MKTIFTTLVATAALVQGVSEENSWKASSYAKNSGVQEEGVKRLFDFRELDGCKRILDIGSGDGKITAQIAKANPEAKVIGIDASKQMVTFAKRAFPHSVHSNLRFYQTKLEEASFQEPFDYVVAFYVMHWIKNKQEAFAYVRKNLVPGGKAFFIAARSLEDNIEFAESLAEAKEAFSSDFEGFVTDYCVASLGQYRRALLHAGFVIDRLQYERRSEVFANLAKFKNWLMQWLPEVKHLPLEKRQPFMQFLLIRYLAKTGQTAQGQIEWMEDEIAIAVTNPPNNG